MDNDIRIFVTITPELEEKLACNEITKDDMIYFKDLIDYFEKYYSSVTFLLPNCIKWVFQTNNFLKPIFNLINRRNSNFNFLGFPSELECDTKENENLIKNFHSKILLFAINKLKKNEIPLLVDKQKKELSKEICKECCDENSLCAHSTKIKTYDFSRKILNEGILKEFCQDSLDRWYFNREILSEKHIKIYMLIYSKFLSCNEGELKKILEIEISDELIEDIKNEEIKTIKEIIISILRSILYTPLSSGDRQEHSIDYHRHEPFREKEWTIYRLDIISPSRSGRHISGARRVIFCEKNNKRRYIYYTSDHDVVNQTMLSRI